MATKQLMTVNNDRMVDRLHMVCNSHPSPPEFREMPPQFQRQKRTMTTPISMKYDYYCGIPAADEDYYYYAA